MSFINKTKLTPVILPECSGTSRCVNLRAACLPKMVSLRDAEQSLPLSGWFMALSLLRLPLWTYDKDIITHIFPNHTLQNKIQWYWWWIDVQQQVLVSASKPVCLWPEWILLCAVHRRPADPAFFKTEKQTGAEQRARCVLRRSSSPVVTVRCSESWDYTAPGMWQVTVWTKWLLLRETPELAAELKADALLQYWKDSFFFTFPPVLIPSKLSQMFLFQGNWGPRTRLIDPSDAADTRFWWRVSTCSDLKASLLNFTAVKTEML